MKMPDDRRVVIFRATLACADAPGKRAQFIGGGLDGIDAGKA